MKIARFLRSTKDTSQPSPPRYRVKKTAFIPYRHPETQRLETSSLDVALHSKADLRIIGESLLTKSPAKGIVVFESSVLKAHELQFEKDGLNHPDHGNILGWPFLEGDYVMRAFDLAETVTEDLNTDVELY